MLLPRPLKSEPKTFSDRFTILPYKVQDCMFALENLDKLIPVCWSEPYMCLVEIVLECLRTIHNACCCFLFPISLRNDNLNHTTQRTGEQRALLTCSRWSSANDCSASKHVLPLAVLNFACSPSKYTKTWKMNPANLLPLIL